MNTPSTSTSSQTVVLIGLEPGFRNRLEAWYRNNGWQVYCAATGPEGRLLAHRVKARYFVVASHLPCESSWVTCAKILCEQNPPRIKMVLNPRSLKECKQARHLEVQVAYPSETGFHGFDFTT